MTSDLKRVAWILPSPFQGGGGYRTILNNIKALENKGFIPYLFISPSPDTDFDNVRKNIRNWYGYDFGNIELVSDLDDSYDAVIATFWTTAFIADNTDISKKLYFCQDFEPFFYPVGDDYLEAERSYKLNLQPVCLGKWLSQMVSSLSPKTPLMCEFGADKQVYFPIEKTQKEHAICAIFQPEKYRRATKLLVDSIAIINRFAPEIKIYLYGSNNNDESLENLDVDNLGLLSPSECNALYNKCKLGISLSATNPSRIPFEMMASGLPVIELDMPNNKLDLPSKAIKFVEYNSEKMARMVCSLIKSNNDLISMSHSGIDFMKNRDLHFESNFFAYQVIEEIEHFPESPPARLRNKNTKELFLQNRDIANARKGVFCFRTRMIVLSISGLPKKMEGLTVYIWSTIDQRDMITYRFDGFKSEHLSICLDLPLGLDNPTKCFFHIYSVENNKESFLFGFEHFFITTDNKSSGRSRLLNLSNIGINCEMTAL